MFESAINVLDAELKNLEFQIQNIKETFPNKTFRTYRDDEAEDIRKAIEVLKRQE